MSPAPTPETSHVTIITATTSAAGASPRRSIDEVSLNPPAQSAGATILRMWHGFPLRPRLERQP